MRKTLLLLFALLGTMAGLAQTNLTSGKTVVPLGGLKSFLPVGAVTEDNLQKITQDGNTDNVFLFPQNGENLAYNQTLGRRVSVLSSQHGKVPTVVPTSM